jgi:hypothetical protein
MEEVEEMVHLVDSEVVKVLEVWVLVVEEIMDLEYSEKEEVVVRVHLVDLEVVKAPEVWALAVEEGMDLEHPEMEEGVVKVREKEVVENVGAIME